MKNNTDVTSTEFDRRNFLKTGAVLGAALCLPQSNISGQQIENYSNNQPMMNQRRILGTGKNSLEVSALGLGCMGMSYHRSDHPDKKMSIDLIHKAVAHGITFFDTAEIYGPYTNEELVGQALVGLRNKVVICTKFGFNFENGVSNGLNSRPENIRRVVEQSLKRLQTDRIDLLYQHRLDPNVPIEDVAGTVGDLIRQGKVKHYGLCEVSTQIIRRAHTVQPLTAIQSEYSLMWKQPKEEVLAVLEELGVGFVPYSPINRGYLGGNINEYTKFDPNNDNRASLIGFTPEVIRKNMVLVEFLNQFGRTRGLTSSQVAMAWLMAQKPWIVPIPGTTKLSHLEENIRTAEYSMTPTEINEIDKAVSQMEIAGDRERNY